MIKSTYSVKLTEPNWALKQLAQDLKATPKWRIFKRLHIKRNIKFWGGE